MAEAAEDHVYKIRRNLSDAGCDDLLIEQFLMLEKKKKRREQYRLLARYKESLLEVLHQELYQIDCLDYMVYSMQEEDRKKKNGGF